LNQEGDPHAEETQKGGRCKDKEFEEILRAARRRSNVNVSACFGTEKNELSGLGIQSCIVGSRQQPPLWIDKIGKRESVNGSGSGGRLAWLQAGRATSLGRSDPGSIVRTTSESGSERSREDRLGKN